MCGGGAYGLYCRQTLVGDADVFDLIWLVGNLPLNILILNSD